MKWRYNRAQMNSDDMMRVYSGIHRGMQLAELFAPDDDHKIRLAAQIGITHGIVMANRVLKDIPPSRYLAALEKIRADLRSAGLVFAGVESMPADCSRSEEH